MSWTQEVSQIYVQELPALKYEFYARPRPFPYNAGAVLTLTAGIGADTFGAYTVLIPAGTFDFNDSPNVLQFRSLSVENVAVADTYVIEFYSTPDAVTYTPLGAIRFSTGAAIALTAIVTSPSAPYDCDANALYGRMKSAAGGNALDFSLEVARFIPCTPGCIPLSTGVWPTG